MQKINKKTWGALLACALLVCMTLLSAGVIVVKPQTVAAAGTAQKTITKNTVRFYINAVADDSRMGQTIGSETVEVITPAQYAAGWRFSTLFPYSPEITINPNNGGVYVRTILKGESTAYVNETSITVEYDLMGSPWQGYVDVALHCSLTYPTYNVVFSLTGGTRTGGGSLEQTIAAGDAAVAPTVQRSGYTFLGWDKSFDAVTSDVTIYAIWDDNPPTYTVTFDIGGGQLTSGTLTQQIIGGRNATPPAVEWEGHTLVRWNGDYNNITSNRTITAEWQIMTFTVIFDAMGGVRTGGGALVQQIEYGQMPELPIVERQYYTLGNWYPIEAWQGGVTSDIHLIAWWLASEDLCKVTFMVGDNFFAVVDVPIGTSLGTYSFHNLVIIK